MGNCCGHDKFTSSRVIQYATHSVPIREVFEFGKVLGEGTYGVVCKARRLNSSDVVAIKSIEKIKVPGHLEDLRTEVKIMLEVDHPNIVRYFHTYEDSEFIHIVMELIDGGELFDQWRQAKRFDEGQVRKYMRQMLMAVASLHSKNIVHRDLKFENFLLDSVDGSLKLIDFGLSAKFTGCRLSEDVGTLPYVAPEVIAANYTDKCDLWSLGVLMYSMLTGRLPFNGRHHSTVIEKIKNAQFSRKRLWHVSKEAIDLILSLLVVNPKRRFNAIEALSHVWFHQSSPCHSELSPTITKSLQKFVTASLFEKEAVTAAARQLPSAKTTCLNKAYATIDPLGVGFINFDSFEDSMMEHSGSLDSREIQEIARAIDLDKDGQITYSHFLAAACFTQFGTDEDYIQAAFNYFDVENTGVITEANLCLGFERLNLKVSKQATREMIASLNLGPEGATYSDFKAILLNNKKD